MQDFYGFFNESNNFLKLFLVLFISVITLLLAKKVFYKFGFLDLPNSRSNHDRPIALGGGIVIIPLIILTSLTYKYVWNLHILISLAILFLISILDDVKNVMPIHRLLLHFFAITIFVLLYINPQLEIFLHQGSFYYYISTILIVLFMTWFINAFNFMDGINGITSVEVLSICASLIFLFYFINEEINVLAFSIFIITLVFCYFNWTPAKIFLGDSGSIPLGFLSIYLLSELALEGFWLSAIILPLYYLMDTGLTLLERIISRKKFWQAHKEHFYQKAIRNGHTHSSVSLRVLLINGGLFLLSFSAVIYENEITFFILGLIWCLFFMYLFSKNIK